MPFNAVDVQGVFFLRNEMRTVPMMITPKEQGFYRNAHDKECMQSLPVEFCCSYFYLLSSMHCAGCAHLSASPVGVVGVLVVVPHLRSLAPGLFAIVRNIRFEISYLLNVQFLCSLSDRPES